MARTRTHQRLGAFGFTAVVGLIGVGALGKSCAQSTPKPAVRTQLPMPAAVVGLVNAQRAAAGVAPVAENGLLAASAAGQSTDQAAHELMTHVGSNGSDPGARLSWVGYQWSAYGENVAAGQTTAKQVMDAWMNSSDHRANILNPTFTNIGIAAVAGANGVTYWTMDLAAPG
jgi:uncharacterized protein YkwD